MSVYLDADVLVASQIEEPRSDTVDRYLRAAPRPLVVSDYTAGEVASAVSRLIRMGRLAEAHARQVLEDFDAWRLADTIGVEIDNADVRLAGLFVRRFALELRMPDAVHAALCHRHGLTLATFDEDFARAARSIGIEVATPA